MKNNQHEKTTDDLLEVIKNNPLDKTIEQIQGEQINITLGEYLKNIAKNRGLKPSDVMKKTGFHKSYFYALLKGTKDNPSRDVLIQLCFGLELNLDETQKFLKTFGTAMLYARNRRDSIIIHAIENRLSLTDCNINLDTYGQKILNE